MTFKFKHLEKIVGIFLTIVVLGIIAVVILVGKERRWFEKSYEFSTEFIRGEGLSTGMSVAIKGIQVGEVKSVFLNEKNLIEVRFSVFEDYRERIRKDSVVKLRAPLIGSKVLEILPGERDMPALANGSYIWSQDTDEGMRILNERAKEEKPDEITRILSNVEALTYNLSSTNGSLNQTLYKVQGFFEMLASEKGSLNQTLKSLDEITRNIKENEGSIGKFMNDNYELYNNVIALFEKLNVIMSDIQNLSKTLSSTSPEIKAAIERSNATMDEAIGLIKILNENFFVKGFSSYKEPKVTPIENIERVGGY